MHRILENAVAISRHGIPMWIRTPVIPGYTDNSENIKRIAAFITEKLVTVERFDLLAFNRMCIEKYTLLGLGYPLKDSELVSQERMEELAGIAREEGVKNVIWSGMTLRDSKSSQKIQGGRNL
ncbi:MAG: hypothetical protein GF411_20710 [Candidatus Lokiarchaeota archaeon]|nr:hypothetical protein [Candidatus Lokiarchaeota archaeon]